MKIVKILSLILTLAMIAVCFASCNQNPNQESATSAADSATQAETEEEITEAETLPEIAPEDLGQPSATYTNSVGSLLESYENVEESKFSLICGYFENAGYTEYSHSEINGFKSATYTKDGEVKHIYFVPSRNELNITTDPKGVSTLPEQSFATGDYPASTVTQYKVSEINGMGFLIKLADGSFIIYDGGYNNKVAYNSFWESIAELNGGSEENIHVRAWILTHSHNDHYPLFVKLAKDEKAANNLKVDSIIYSPLASDARTRDDGTGNTYFNSKILPILRLYKDRGATVCIAHTGMNFHIQNMNLRIMMTADEMFIEQNFANFNESSLVSRLECDGSKSMIFLADAAKDTAAKLNEFYGADLKSDMCQAAHHGVEDFPIEVYNVIQPEIMFYPCTQSLYDLTDRDADVRKAIREAEYTKEVLVRADQNYTRSFSK